MSKDSNPLSLSHRRTPDHALPEGTVPVVLLVNDTPDLRRLKRMMLEGAGYTVAEVVDGRDALAFLRASRTSLVVVMNTRIPSIGGAGILHTVANEPQLQRHAFVLTTALAGHLSDELFHLTHQLHTQVLGKPFTEQELLGAVTYAVARLDAHKAAHDKHA